MEYKASMERIAKWNSPSTCTSIEEDGSRNFISKTQHHQQQNFFCSSFFQTNTLYLDVILFAVVPIAWSMLAVFVLCAKDVLDLWYMPFLGIFAACLANAVPIGGGIIYVPAFMVRASRH